MTLSAGILLLILLRMIINLHKRIDRLEWWRN